MVPTNHPGMVGWHNQDIRVKSFADGYLIATNNTKTLLFRLTTNQGFMTEKRERVPTKGR